MITLTVITDSHGDMVVHVAGCSDIKRSHRYDTGARPQTFTGADMAAAITAVDTDYADMFGLDVYMEDAPEQAWTVSHMKEAPCFTKARAAAGITFGALGRPVAK